MVKKLLFFFSIFLMLFTAKAQSCNCDVTLTGLKQNSLNIILASQVNYVPGNTICIPAGTYAGFRFFDFEGTESDPVIFKNCGGKVEIIEQQYTGIAFKRSKFIRITGTGDQAFEYGIHVKEVANGGSSGIGIEDLSSDFEIDHIEIENTGFAGIMAKTDPSCSNPDTWRSNGYVLKNLEIHHNYIHNTGAEGIYIGYTGGYKIKTNRSCNGIPIFGHWLENVDIHHNLLEHIAWDGIQLNLVRENGWIRDNTIIDYGTDNRYAQDFAMSIGGGIYRIYNNYMENGPANLGQGMQFISAESGTQIYNNVLVKPDFHGIFMHNRHEFDDVSEGYYVANNTIVEPGASGVYYNTVITQTNVASLKYSTQENVPTYFVNNLIIDPGNDHASGNTWKGNQESYFDFNKRIERDSSLSRIYSNIMTRQMDTLGLRATETNDFSPADASSDLVDTGSDVSVWGIVSDITNLARPQGGDFDIGAYELFNGTPLLAGLPDEIQLSDFNNELEVFVFPNPAHSNIQVKNVVDSKVNLKLISFDGRTVLDNTYNSNETIQIEEFSSGLYFLKITSKNKSVIKRLVIK